MRLALAGALLAALSSSAGAAEWSVVVSTVSVHVDDHDRARTEEPCSSTCKSGHLERPRRTLNNENYGAGIGMQFSPRLGAIVGAFENSHWRTSAYAVATVRLVDRWWLAAGYVSGYERRVPVSAALMLELGVARVLVAPDVASLWFALPLRW